MKIQGYISLVLHQKVMLCASNEYQLLMFYGEIRIKKSDNDNVHKLFGKKRTG